MVATAGSELTVLGPGKNGNAEDHAMPLGKYFEVKFRECRPVHRQSAVQRPSNVNKLSYGSTGWKTADDEICCIARFSLMPAVNTFANAGKTSHRNLQWLKPKPGIAKSLQQFYLSGQLPIMDDFTNRRIKWTPCPRRWQ